MSNEIIKDFNVLHSHPANMLNHINEIVKVLNDVQLEGYELYNVVEKEKKDCEANMNEARYELAEAQSCNGSSADEALHREAMAKKKITSYQAKMLEMQKNQRLLNNISQQCVRLKKTSDKLLEDIGQTNSAFKSAIKFLEESQ